MSKRVRTTRDLLLMATLLGDALFAKATDKEMTIGTIYLDAQGYYVGVRQGVQDTVKDSSVQVQLIEANAQDDISEESTFVSTLVVRDVDTIILSAVSENSSSRAVHRASEADIPVICYNTCINQKRIDKYVSTYLVGNPLEFGKKLGNATANYFIANKIGQPRIAVISCGAFEVYVQQRKGSEKVLKSRVPGTQIIANQRGTVLSKTIPVGEKLIISTPDLNAVVGESGGATFDAVRAVHNQNQTGKIAVFGSDMTTEIARGLENNQVLKAMVDISDKKMDDTVFTQTLKIINKQADGEKVIRMPIDLYTKTEDGKQWLTMHVDGLS